jgi:antitoxin (DNA-binding transcriptional repressor) of toxin-antitoxin stability system
MIDRNRTGGAYEGGGDGGRGWGELPAHAAGPAARLFARPCCLVAQPVFPTHGCALIRRVGSRTACLSAAHDSRRSLEVALRSVMSLSARTAHCLTRDTLTRMSDVSIRDLRNHGGEVVDRAARGEQITITRAGRPVAELRALSHAPLAVEVLLERWRGLPEVDPAALHRDIDRLLDASL